MKVYVLEVFKIEETHNLITSSYKAPRHLTKTEYYANKTLANSRADEIYNGVNKLLGCINYLEVTIKEVEVIE